MNIAAVSGALAALVTTWTPAQAPAGASLELSAVRFYRGSASQTLVDVFCRIPFALLVPLGGGDGGAAYQVAVSVRDSSGLELLARQWSQTVGAALVRMPGASTAEHFAFGARPGRYSVAVAVTDSATGRVSRQRTEVVSFAALPWASDLLLANALRQAVEAGDSVPRPGEIRKGSLFLQTSGRPVLTPEQASLGYYEELYPQRAETATVTVRVKGAAGNQIVATPPQELVLSPQGGATRGTVDLSGLPPGAYRLEVAVAMRDSEVVRSAEFGMAGFETEAAVAAVSPRRARDPFDDLSEGQLDSLYQPLIYLMTAEEEGTYSSLTVEGKRRFLRQFWAKRDPTPGTPRNEVRDAFYVRIGEANRRFKEGGAAELAGWRTDRGRVFVRYGEPDEVLSRPQAGSTSPYEVWKYTRGRYRKFVFMDLTRFGNYSLIFTNERREPSRPNWQELLGPEAVQDAERF